MQKIIGAFKPPKGAKRDDDAIDRLSNKYTVGVLVMFAIVLGVILNISKSPLTCWCPKHFTGSHVKYANSYCWIRNTYHLPYEEDVPKADEHHDYILYYQWLPIILLGQAAMFYAPSIFWHGLNQKSGVDADHILQNAVKVHQMERGKDRASIVKHMVYLMDRFLATPYMQQTGWQAGLKRVLCCGRTDTRIGNYLTLLYLMSKLLYIANVIGQLYMLNAILRTNYQIFGVEYIRNMMTNVTYAENSNVFPKVTMCDFQKREIGNVQRYTLQCTLPLNLFAEKMYVFLWFWMMFIAIMSCLGFVIWFSRLLFRRDRLLFIRNHLQAVGEMDKPDAEQLSARFLDDYLKQDGAFLLRLIIHNTSHVCCTEILHAMYLHWKENVHNAPPEVGIEADDASISEHTV